MGSPLQHPSSIDRGAQGALITGVLSMSAAILIGPLFSPPEFSWVQHTTSEQAGQAMPGAWIMRGGFTAFGLGIIVAALSGISERTAVRTAMLGFGAGMVATAIWSNAPIIPNAQANLQEDRLHSVASGVVGAAFAAACAASLFAPGGTKRDVAAWAGLIIAVAIPLAMNAFPEWRGLLQRLMFAYSFFFVIREFLRP